MINQQNNLMNNQLLKAYQNYQNHQHSNVPFQNNTLLQNNPIFQNNMMQNNSAQVQQMKMMQMAYSQKLQDVQKVKQIEKLNELESKLDKEKIRDCVIKPIKVENDNREVRAKLKEMEASGIYVPDKDNILRKYWDSRTNQPYKNIIKDDNYVNKFLNKPAPKTVEDRKQLEKDLIVHKVTNADKEGVETEYRQLEGKLEKHNDELKVIYSTTQEAEHKKKFEYNHIYKYRVKYDPSDHNKMKNDRMSYYKKQQKNEENQKDQVDNIIESLINEGIFNEKELTEIGYTKVEVPNTKEDIKRDAKDITKENTKEIVTKPQTNNKTLLSNNRSSNNKPSNNIPSNNGSSNNGSSNNILPKKSSPPRTINDRDKYMMRQKKKLI